MKKLVSMLLVLALALSLCGAAMAEGGKTTIQFWHSGGGKQGQAIDHMVETFNGIQDKYEVVATYQGDYYTSIANAIKAVATGNGPDLIQTGSGQVNLLSDEEGVVANMFDFLSKDEGLWFEDFYTGFIDYYVTEVDGKPYLPCLPMGCSTPVLYCNKTLLDNNNLAIPTTWDEMVAVCEKLVDGGITKYGFAEPRDSWYFFMWLPNFTGKDVVSEDGLRLDCREEGIEVFTWLEELVKKNYFYPGPATDGGTIITQMMQAQECAFYINSIGGLGTQQSAAEAGGYELVVAEMPGKVNHNVPSGGNSLVLLNSATEEKQAGAWEFLKWIYTNEDGMPYFDSMTGYYACTQTITNSKTIQDKMANDANYANAYANIANVNNNHCVKGWSETATPIMSFMDACFYDTEDVAAQWDVLEEAVNEKLAEANED